MSQHNTEKLIDSQSRTKRIRSLSPGEAIRVESAMGASGKFLIYKERGETLAVLVRRFRAEQDLGQGVRITYAGRLDPMAEGVVLLLVGDDRHHKDALLGLSKTYEVEVLLGIGTDTQDMLGLIERESHRGVTKDHVHAVLAQALSIEALAYPAYSSVIVDGKPLFAHARAGTLVQAPHKKVAITEATLLHVRTVPVEAIARDALNDIARVEGDFRQLAIMKQWQECIQTHKDVTATIITIRVRASSGTYMRSLAAWIGERLGMPALAYKIKRTKLGEYTV